MGVGLTVDLIEGAGVSLQGGERVNDPGVAHGATHASEHTEPPVSSRTDPTV